MERVVSLQSSAEVEAQRKLTRLLAATEVYGERAYLAEQYGNWDRLDRTRESVELLELEFRTLLSELYEDRAILEGLRK